MDGAYFCLTGHKGQKTRSAALYFKKGSVSRSFLEKKLHRELFMIFMKMVPGEGFEPPAFGLQNRCTTTVLTRHYSIAAIVFPLFAEMSRTVKQGFAGLKTARKARAENSMPAEDSFW